SGERKEFFARERVQWLGGGLEEGGRLSTNALDYGCGTGGTNLLLRQILGSGSGGGLDVSTLSVQQGRARHWGGGQVITVDGYAPDGSVDVVYCNGVFHHIPVAERAAAVDYVFRCLRPGGIFALWENNPWNPGTQYVMYKCEFDHAAVKISPPEAARLLRKGGFEVLRKDFRFFFPRALKVMRPAESLLVKVPLGGQYQVLARKPM